MRRLLYVLADGKSDAESGAGAVAIHKGKGAAVLGHDFRGDGQPQAGAAGLAGTSLVHAVEALKHMGTVFGRDADPVVADFQPGFLAFRTIPAAW